MSWLLNDSGRAASANRSDDEFFGIIHDGRGHLQQGPKHRSCVISFCGSTDKEWFQLVRQDVEQEEYSMACVFVNDVSRSEDGWRAAISPEHHAVWWAMWTENVRNWIETGQDGYFVYNAENELGAGQRRELEYLETDLGFQKTPLQSGESEHPRSCRYSHPSGNVTFQMVSIDQFRDDVRAATFGLQDVLLHKELRGVRKNLFPDDGPTWRWQLLLLAFLGGAAVGAALAKGRRR